MVREAPVLTDIIIERASERFEPRPQADARGRLRNWWGRGWNSISTITHRASSARGIRLLKENLSPAQLDQYEKSGYFHVIGGTTGTHYRIRNGHQMNVEQLDKNNKRICMWCFMPEGGLVDGDTMLAQKLALELFGPEALRVANRVIPAHDVLCPMP